jgi:hypothetical protein
MPRSSKSRSPVSMTVWLVAAALVIGAVFATTKLTGSSSSNSVELASKHSWRRPPKPCPTPAGTQKTTFKSKWGTYTDSRGATQHLGDGQEPLAATNCAQPTVAPTNGSGNGNGGGNNGGGATATPVATGSAVATPAPSPSGLDVLARDCSGSKLPEHDGFQNGNRCVTTEFGEVADAAKNPSLLIVGAPRQVRVGQTFTLSVSTRNLVRDRFLGAAAGGYYKETSLLNGAGLVRGHFHTACRMLPNQNEAPAPDPVPAFFVATEDGSGSATPDTVKITVAGMPTQGTAECASWAGDGSHRIPMMQRANQIPAFDVVRVRVN